MLVQDDTESHLGAEPGPVGAVMVNGTFETRGDACIGSSFSIGEKFGGWIMTVALKKRAPVMQLGAGAGTDPAHCFDGHLAVLSGSISQTLVTEVGVSYKLTYESFGAEANRVGASICEVVIDGTVVQTIVAAAWPDAVPHVTYFTAQSDETVLSFSTVGREPFTLGNVTASRVTQAAFCERGMLKAMFSD